MASVWNLCLDNRCRFFLQFEKMFLKFSNEFHATLLFKIVEACQTRLFIFFQMARQLLLIPMTAGNIKSWNNTIIPEVTYADTRMDEQIRHHHKPQ